MSDDQIEAIGEPSRWGDEFDARGQAVLRLADAMCGDTHALDPDLVTELRALFSEAELAELVLVAGQANMNNRSGNAAKQLLGAPPD